MTRFTSIAGAIPRSCGGIDATAVALGVCRYCAMAHGKLTIHLLHLLARLIQS
jgi:hypothetical protein